MGDKLTMTYDFSVGWKFHIELISIEPMESNRGKAYPRVTGGAGKEMVEDMSPHELAQIIEKTKEEGVIPNLYSCFSQSDEPWDYRDLDVKFCSGREYKTFFREIRDGYLYD